MWLEASMAVLLVASVVLLTYHLDRRPLHPVGTVRIVVSRYAEDLAWLNHPAFARHEILVVNKGAHRPTRLPDHALVVSRPNVGKCDETFLWYCEQAYDDLTDTTVFLPGCCRRQRGKWAKTLALMRLVARGHRTVFLGSKSRDLQRDMYDFRVDRWASADPQNRLANGDARVLPSAIRPFGPWWDVNMPGETGRFVVYQGIFAASRDAIRSNPRDRYSRLREQLATHRNPEAGHYVERVWATLLDRANRHGRRWLQPDLMFGPSTTA